MSEDNKYRDGKPIDPAIGIDLEGVRRKISSHEQELERLKSILEENNYTDGLSTHFQSHKKKHVNDEFNWAKHSILIVEDNYVSFKLLQAFLQKSEAKVLHADTGLKAIDMIVKHPEINIVLMDVQLPEMNGYEATREIRKIRPALPIIAQTANSMEEEMINCLHSGCNEFVTKPIAFNNLLSLIDKYLKEIV